MQINILKNQISKKWHISYTFKTNSYFCNFYSNKHLKHLILHNVLFYHYVILSNILTY